MVGQKREVNVLTRQSHRLAFTGERQAFPHSSKDFEKLIRSVKVVEKQMKSSEGKLEQSSLKQLKLPDMMRLDSAMKRKVFMLYVNGSKIIQKHHLW